MAWAHTACGRTYHVPRENVGSTIQPLPRWGKRAPITPEVFTHQDMPIGLVSQENCQLSAHMNSTPTIPERARGLLSEHVCFSLRAFSWLPCAGQKFCE